MAKIFDTAYLTENSLRSLPADHVSNIYNGLDAALTLEIFQVLEDNFVTAEPCVTDTYQLGLKKLGPVFEMSMRGMRVDESALAESVTHYTGLLNKLKKNFDFICEGVFGRTYNTQSPQQMQQLLYTDLGIKPITTRKGGQTRITTDESALLKISLHPLGMVFANYILQMRVIAKKLSFLRTKRDEDGRMRSSYNVAGTNTGRLSSSGNDFGTGTNLQNVEEELRKPFIADPGKVLFNIDLEQADARNIGAILWTLFYESHGPEEAGKYLDFCESGDLHTNVCKLVFPDLDWPGDPKGDRAIAELLFYRHYTYRQACKQLGHGTNYRGKPHQMSIETQISTPLIKSFQVKYFLQFPLISAWHDWIPQQLKAERQITTLFGRRRTFWGRVEDAATVREATAYAPQSMTAHEIDQGFMQVWDAHPTYELLNQVHDSVLFQIPFHNREMHTRRIIEAMRVRLPLIGGREFEVPLDGAQGFNWAYESESNPNGLIKLGKPDARKLPVYKKLDRPVHGSNGGDILTALVSEVGGD